MREAILPFSSDTDTGKCVVVRGMGLVPLFVRLHKMELTSALVSGEVEVAVRPELPVDGVDMILGNDLAGDRVWPDQVGFQADHAPVLLPSMSLECAPVSEVFTACAVTRTMAQANISAACEKKAEKMPLFIPVPLQFLPHGEFSEEQKVDPP